MKTLLIGEVLSGSGYAKALIGYAMALEAVGEDVVIRNVSMTAPKKNVSKWLIDKLNKDIQSVDCVFQFNLPTEFRYVDNGFKNICGFAYETDQIPKHWVPYLEPFDNIVLPCSKQIASCPSLAKKITVIPHAIDTSLAFKEYPKMNFGTSDNGLRFYTVSEFNKRKNVAALIAAYLGEFDSSDDVSLVLKCHVPGYNKDQSRDIIAKSCEEIKEGLKRFGNKNRYPQTVLITDFLSEEALSAIHANCDVFVSASKGEGFGIPTFDAYSFGSTLLLPEDETYKEYLEGLDDVYLAESRKEYCYGINDGLPDLYKSEETWNNPNILDLRQQMRHLFNIKNSVKNRKSDVSKNKYIEENFGYNAVGKKLKDLIDAK